jgi:hypothetical protein
MPRIKPMAAPINACCQGWSDWTLPSVIRYANGHAQRPPNCLDDFRFHLFGKRIHESCGTILDRRALLIADNVPVYPKRGLRIGMPELLPTPRKRTSQTSGFTSLRKPTQELHPNVKVSPAMYLSGRAKSVARVRTLFLFGLLLVQGRAPAQNPSAQTPSPTSPKPVRHDSVEVVAHLFRKKSKRGNSALHTNQSLNFSERALA